MMKYKSTKSYALGICGLMMMLKMKNINGTLMISSYTKGGSFSLLVGMVMILYIRGDLYLYCLIAFISQREGKNQNVRLKGI